MLDTVMLDSIEAYHLSLSSWAYAEQNRESAELFDQLSLCRAREKLRLEQVLVTVVKASASRRRKKVKGE